MYSVSLRIVIPPRGNGKNLPPHVMQLNELLELEGLRNVTLQRTRDTQTPACPPGTESA